MLTIQDSIASLHLGEATLYEGLTVFPLFSESSQEKDYLTLDEALEQGQGRVTEVSESGSVPTLRFENLSDKRVLLVDGDELIGAKQNRIINLTIMVAAHTGIDIPVSCVEAGRWRHESREFKSEKRAMMARSRANKSASVSASMKQAGSRRSDQGEVWEDVALYSRTLNVDSPTGSMSDIYDGHEAALDNYKKAFKAGTNQVGALFAVNGRIQGLEVFDSSVTFANYLERLVSSYAITRLAERGEVEFSATPDATGFLDRVGRASTECFKALGEGDDLRLSGDGLAGGALRTEDRIYHLVVFDLQNPNNKSGHRAESYRRRRPH
jgi:hypothetical protein